MTENGPRGRFGHDGQHLLATEASMAGVFALSFKVKGWPSEGPAFMVNMAPLVIGLYFAFSDAKGTRGTELLSAPKLTTDSKRSMMSFGGSF